MMIPLLKKTHQLTFFIKLIHVDDLLTSIWLETQPAGSFSLYQGAQVCKNHRKKALFTMCSEFSMYY